MPTIAIVGAGPGLGLSIARTFGANGFDVALIARTRATLDDLAAQLAQDGITAAAFTADVTDRPALTAALTAAADHFDGIDVLEYSPASRNPVPGVDIVPPSATTPDNAQAQIDYYLHGALAATHAVLPAMREAGSGTL